MKDLRDHRENYDLGKLLESQVAADAMEQFHKWFEEYRPVCKGEINVMTLSTLGSYGPTSRIVLLKQYDETGLVFFTNYESRKGQELAGDDRAGLLFFWPELQRQVRIQGRIEKISESESDEYFNSRPRESQLGAWTSPQSEVISSREILENKYEELNSAYEGREVPRPDHWGGYILRPERVEFWQGRPSRLHDRLEYLKEEGDWKIQRLAP